MGIPVLYQGSLYAPVPFVPIPPDVTPPSGGPQFSSAEIGTFNASTVVVTFDQDVLAAENDYASGVTIKVNGVATSISGGIRQANHAVIYYGIPVLWHGSGDVVTWEYNSATGIIVAESGGAALGNVAAQSVTNNCEYAALLDLQADTLALNDGDPVSTWADQSGQGHDFTQTGTARPTKRTTVDYPAIEFDNTDDWMLGSDFADNLLSFDIMFLAQLDIGGYFIGKINNVFTSPGWAYDNYNLGFCCQDSGQANSVNQTTPGGTPTGYQVETCEKLSNSSMNIFIDGVNCSSYPDDGAFHTLANFSNSEPIRIGTDAQNQDISGFVVRAIMILTSSPNATNRAALETRLGARYGLVVP